MPMTQSGELVYAVKALCFDGSTAILAKSFATREAAEEHPVVLSKWKRVWIEAIFDKEDLCSRQS